MGSMTTRRRAFKVLDAEKGDDSSVTWDPDDAASVENAQASFDYFRSKGYLAYRRSKEGGKGEQVSKFDPSAEEIIFAPPLVGG